MQKISKKSIQLAFKNIKQIYKAGIRLHKMAQKAGVFGYTGFLTISCILAIFPFFNSYVSSLVIDTIINTLNSSKEIAVVLQMIFIYLLVLLTENILATVRRYFGNIQYMDFYNYMTVKMLDAFSKLDIGYFENSKYNDAIQKARDSYTYKPINFLELSFMGITDLVSMVYGLFLVVAVSPILIVIIVVANIPTFILNILFGKRKYGIWNEDAETRRNFWDMTNYLDSEKNLYEIKIFNLRKYFLTTMKKLLYQFQDKQKNIETKRSIVTGLFSVLGVLSFGLAYYIIAIKTISGDLSVGQFTFYIATIRTTSAAISSMLSTFTRLYEDGLYTLDVLRVLDFKRKVKSGKLILNKGVPEINFKNVSFKYPSSKNNVYTKLNFKIKPGEKIAIVGKNGAGKTTLVKILARFYDVTDGELQIDKINIKNIKIANWRSKIAILNQEFVKYHFDARTNIMLGKVNVDDENRIIKSSELSGAHDFIKDYKYKYLQILDKRYKKGIDPSTGQWQKIALARAFYKDAPILVLDEPTSAIDPKAEFEIFEKLFEYAKEKTVIIISHRFSTVINADRIIVLDKGKIVEEGSHKELLEKNGIYKEAFDLQKKGYEDI